MAGFGRWSLWNAIRHLRSRRGMTLPTLINGIVQYTRVPLRTLCPLTTYESSLKLDLQEACICSRLATIIYGSAFRIFFEERNGFLARVAGLVLTYTPNLRTTYRKALTREELGRIIELSNVIKGVVLAHSLRCRLKYEPVWVLLADHRRMRFVVVVRGTQDLGDVLIDGEVTPVELLDRYYIHKGMLQAAKYITRTLHPAIERYKETHCARCYTLLITGHSLGAGVAAALGIYLQAFSPQTYEGKIRVVGFGCPAMGSMPFCRDAHPWITNYIYDTDMACRLSVHSVLVLQERIRRLHQSQEEGRRLCSEELSELFHTEMDLYVPGRLVLIQPIGKEGSYPEGNNYYHPEDMYTPAIEIANSAFGGRKEYTMREARQHELGELILNEAGIFDHGAYSHVFKFIEDHNYVPID
ncbi:Lipase [Giardia muris]|uniref:sn-1-specific diacylglycerol lipase n=1 Tax=Giardia muris TaxID=5742 RepID=A0A4Z1SUD2_GIAMU|nr:Lipase [Giardia muris]|eukprot:TNJ29454.1 Lipase [Giardia muris]